MTDVAIQQHILVVTVVLFGADGHIVHKNRCHWLALFVAEVTETGIHHPLKKGGALLRAEVEGPRLDQSSCRAQGKKLRRLVVNLALSVAPHAIQLRMA